MTNEFAVIGHHRDDVEALLLLGADGRHYRYHLSDTHLNRVEPHGEWVLDAGTEPPAASSAPGAPHTHLSD